MYNKVVDLNLGDFAVIFKRVNGQDRDLFLMSKKLEDFQFNLMPCLKEKGYSLTDELSDILGFIMYDDNKPIASIGLKKVTDDRCEIVRVFVDENYRGRGYAKLLFQKIEELAITLGFKFAEMVAWQKAKEATSLYVKLGYTASEEKESAWFDGLKYIEFLKELK